MIILNKNLVITFVEFVTFLSFYCLSTFFSFKF